MKKLLILLTTMLFGITASFAQVDIVNVSWDASNCFEGTCGESANDYFKITVSIYDDANGEYVVLNKIVTESNMSAEDKDVDVSEVSTYCNKSHDFTPSFTVYATVDLMDDNTNPPSSCCTASDDDSLYTCRDFYDGVVNMDVGMMN